MESILVGVVAYVEVRSSSDNRSAAISHELELLGATVVPNFSDDVTHLVFKEGLKRTWLKATKRKIPIVSVSWLESCKKQMTKVPEQDFPAILPEEHDSPLVTKRNGVRWKKMKSMQPTDFDEELARSAERGEKRRKRIMMANRFKLSEDTTPTHSPVQILALETQARSPQVLALSRTGAGSAGSFIPETPPSLKERLEKMRREQREALGLDDESPTGPPRSTTDGPPQRKLFDKFSSPFTSTDDENEDEDKTSSVVANLIKGLESPHVSDLRKKQFLPHGTSPLAATKSNLAGKTSTHCSNIQPHNLVFSLNANNNAHHSSNTDYMSHTATTVHSENENVGKKSKRNSFAATPENRRRSRRLTKDSNEFNLSQHHHQPLPKPKLSCNTNASKENPTSPTRKRSRSNGSSGVLSPLANISNTNLSVNGKGSDLIQEEPAADKREFGLSSLVKENSSTIKIVSNSNPGGNQVQPSASKVLKKKKTLYSEPATSSPLFRIMTDDSATSTAAESSDNNKSCNQDSMIKGKRKRRRDSDTEFLYGSAADANVCPDDNSGGNRRKSRRIHSPNAKSKSVLLKQDKASCDHSDVELEAEKTSNNENASCDEQALGTSMSLLYDIDPELSVSKLTASRRSVDEFSLNQLVKKKKKGAAGHKHALAEISEEPEAVGLPPPSKSVKPKRQLSTVNCKYSPKPKPKAELLARKSSDTLQHAAGSVKTGKTFTDATVDSGDADTSPDGVSVPSKKLRHARSFVMGQATTKSSMTGDHSMVMTSLHRKEQEVVFSVVKTLKVFHMTNDVTSSTTHVVCGEPRRTLNVLRAIARGCWLLSQEWVLRSFEEREWLLEEEFEMDCFPAAKESRIARQKFGKGYKLDLFSSVGPIYVSCTSTPPRKELVSLITLCSGQVTGSNLRASLHIGEECIPDKTVVKPAWILDSITQLKCLPQEEYLVQPERSSQRESSPEF